MLKNNISVDLKHIFLNENVKQIDLAKEMNISRQSLSKKINTNKFVADSLIDICDALGYDIEINYIKKEK